MTCLAKLNFRRLKTPKPVYNTGISNCAGPCFCDPQHALTVTPNKK